MFEEPDEPVSKAPRDPAQRARERAEEFLIHAEMAATFEGTRKFAAELRADLDAELAREVQRGVAKLAKAKLPDVPVLPASALADAQALLALPAERGLAAGDYHVYRRPGEVMAVRWLEGDAVATWYERLQAHFNAALGGFREDERHALEWKGDEATLAYLKALDEIDLKMEERYLREVVRAHGLPVLSTLTADELNIAFLAEDVMGVQPADLVGDASAPGRESVDADRTWFFKLFSLRGKVGEAERVLFFAFLQKTDDSLGDW